MILLGGDERLDVYVGKLLAMLGSEDTSLALEGDAVAAGGGGGVVVDDVPTGSEEK